MAKEKSENNYLDKLKDKAIEVRTEALAYLESQIEKQDMDAMEAFSKLKAICLFNDKMAADYIKGISTKQKLWRVRGEF